MTSNHKQTLELLQKLKHKRFSSQNDTNSQSPFLDQRTNYHDMKNGFVCSYHPNQVITNFCITDGQDRPKPLCPRCLQQHIKTHQQRSTTCKLQTADTEIKRISTLLNQRLTKCSILDEKIINLNEWKSQSIQQMKFQLKKYKKQITQSIQNLFNSLEAQLVRKYQQQNNTYEQLVKVLQFQIPNLKQISNRSLYNLNEKKDLNNVLLNLPQITQKYFTLINNEKKMIQGCSINPQIRFNRSKLTQAMNFIKISLQYKFNKINQYELDQKLKKITYQKSKLIQNNKNEQKTLTKLQKILTFNNSTTKLHTIDMFKQSQQNQKNKQHKQQFSSTVPSSPRDFNKTYQSTNTKVQTSNNKDMLEKLNNTTNRLKSSLNGFYKANKNDVYQ